MSTVLSLALASQEDGRRIVTPSLTVCLWPKRDVAAGNKQARVTLLKLEDDGFPLFSHHLRKSGGSKSLTLLLLSSPLLGICSPRNRARSLFSTFLDIPLCTNNRIRSSGLAHILLPIRRFGISGKMSSALDTATPCCDLGDT